MWKTDKQRGNRHQRGYGADWDKLRLYILVRDDYLCQPCLEKGRLTPANAVDHIISKAKGGTDEEENLQAICNACHELKTLEETGKKRRPEFDIDGNPIGAHAWNI